MLIHTQSAGLGRFRMAHARARPRKGSVYAWNLALGGDFHRSNAAPASQGSGFQGGLRTYVTWTTSGHHKSWRNRSSDGLESPGPCRFGRLAADGIKMAWEQEFKESEPGDELSGCRRHPNCGATAARIKVKWLHLLRTSVRIRSQPEDREGARTRY
jgi:hypothetical protein